MSATDRTTRLRFEPTIGTATECYNVGLRGEECTVAHTHQGVTRTTEVPGDAYEAGDQVRLRFDPDHPHRVRRGDVDGFLPMLAVDVIAATLLTVALLGLRRSRRKGPAGRAGEVA